MSLGAKVQLGGGLLAVFTHRDVLEEQVLQMQKLESLGRLAGEVAHDLRNLLAVYICNIEYIKESLDGGQITAKEPPIRAELEEVLDELVGANERADGLTKRLLGFSRIEDEEMRPIDVPELMEDVVKLARRVFPQDIRIECDVADLPLAVSASAGRLHQALMNLCINARDAILVGGNITLRARRVSPAMASSLGLTFTGSADYALLSVADSGQGMDEVTQGRIFEPFFTTKPKGQGTGLGLATVYAVVKELAGHISVRSAPDRGTTFNIALPLATQSGQQWKATQGGQRSTTMLQELPSILVVSASNSGRKNLARCLGNLAYRVLWEEQSRDGLAVLSGESDKIVAVILDKDMQGMSIEQWAAAARRMTSRIAFLLWAPNAEPGEALDRVAAVARVHAVLLSPVDTDSLDKAISQAISLRVSYG